MQKKKSQIDSGALSSRVLHIHETKEKGHFKCQIKSNQCSHFFFLQAVVVWWRENSSNISHWRFWPLEIKLVDKTKSPRGRQNTSGEKRYEWRARLIRSSHSLTINMKLRVEFDSSIKNRVVESVSDKHRHFLKLQKLCWSKLNGVNWDTLNFKPVKRQLYWFL